MTPESSSSSSGADTPPATPSIASEPVASFSQSSEPFPQARVTVTASSSSGIDTPPTPLVASESVPSSSHSGKPFSQANVAFAVDVSSSTAGRTILAERRFISTVSALIDPQPRSHAAILPWDRTAYPILGVSQVDTLRPKSGTDPRVLLSNQPFRDAILRSDLWFLMTDGLINEHRRYDFAETIPKTGVHGTSCVIVIFGNPAHGPGACNISVGVSVFAVVPNCAFLFCNTNTGELRLFQTRGAFNSLLRGRPPPVFDGSSKWDTLPLLNRSDFVNIRVPPSQNLKADEVALQGSLIINLDDLLSNRLSKDQVSSILADEDNLSTVVMTSRTRNRQDAFQNWVRQQAIVVDDPIYKPRGDMRHAAQSAFEEVIRMVQRGIAPPDQLRLSLRQAYLANMRQFVREIQRNKEAVRDRRDVIRSTTKWSTMNFNHGASLCRPASTADGNRQKQSPGDYSHTTPADPASVSTPHEESYKSWEDNTTDPQISRLLYTPGFQSTGGAFRGHCAICGAREMKMAFLFLDVPASSATVGLPPPGSRTSLDFLFAMGSLHGMDVLSSTFCCDPCSSFAVKTGLSTSSAENIKASIPLVRYADNKASINGALDKIFSLRSTEGDLPMVFLSVLLTARPRLASSGQTTAVSAIDWAVKDLVHTTPVLGNLSGSLSRPETGKFPQPLAHVLKELFTDETELSEPLTRYPLPGFVVLLAAAESAGIEPRLRELAALRRLLFLLVEEFFRARESTPVDDKTALAAILEDILWRRRKMSPALPVEDREPVLDVSILSLVGTEILTEQSYSMMQQADEFRKLEGRSLLGVDWVIAIFLHALFRNTAAASGSGAWGVFEAIMKSSFMVEGVAKFRDLGEEGAKGLYGDIMRSGVSSEGSIALV
ncbi:uncharacterized protein DNG_05184 [Cephalotrichum gorgonifer]|uniref:Uncharacterized protein n=1 Tax=Cephalotrichum gorgonifer TaxID=2041049 RepID=A0AAE8MXD2_9PEZI|nr:uncharacterized protein DNG_05184 [Cephalotrichum gorgonifer]